MTCSGTKTLVRLLRQQSLSCRSGRAPAGFRPHGRYERAVFLGRCIDGGVWNAGRGLGSSCEDAETADDDPDWRGQSDSSATER